MPVEAGETKELETPLGYQLPVPQPPVPVGYGAPLEESGIVMVDVIVDVSVPKRDQGQHFQKYKRKFRAGGTPHGDHVCRVPKSPINHLLVVSMVDVKV